MVIDLKDRIALVTGSSRGIGWEIARTLGLSGAKVAICARDRAELKLATAQLTAAGICSIAMVSDLTKAGTADRVVNRVIKEWGGLDLLINNVGGIPQTGRFEELADEAWVDAFQLNLMPTVRFCRIAIPHLQKSRFPRIINLSSMVAAQPGSYNPHYSAFKAAIVNLSKHLSGVYAKHGVRVNCISPGIIHTEGWDLYIAGKAAEQGIDLATCAAEENSRAVQNVPLKRLGLPQEVAGLVAFLASDHGAFITGSNYRVDGGRVQAAG